MITNATNEQVVNAIFVANGAYNGNIKLKKIKNIGKRISFTLTVANSKNKGSRIGRGGRRIAAACFHSHYAVMRELFKQNEKCYIKSCFARYDGLQDLENKASYVGMKNIGSQCEHLSMDSACNC